MITFFLSKAEQYSADGDLALKRLQFTDAYKFYTKAIDFDRSSKRFTDRANAYLKHDKHDEAIKDSKMALDLDD